MRASATNPDPYRFNEYSSQPGYYNPNGRVLVDPKLNPALRNIKLLVLGQSITTNSVNDTFNPVNVDKVQNFSIFDGSVSKAIVPMLGCSNTAPNMGNLLLRLGDIFVNCVADRVIIAPIASGGSYIADWAPGGVLNSKISASIKRMGSYGLMPDGVFISIGESDGIEGTTQANFTARLNATIGSIRDAGYTGPIFVNRESWINGTTYSAIQNAQDAVVNHGSGIWAGGNFDTIINAGRYDTTHFNELGASIAAQMMLEALQDYGAPFV